MDMVSCDHPIERPYSTNKSSSTVISGFAIVILSIIGSLFARNHHMVMGLEEDAEDPKAVATSIFITVAIYAVGLLAP